VPTWNQIYTMLRSQAGKIRCSGFKPDVIVGVSRGGFVPARILSDLLGIHALTTVGVKFYLGVAETRTAPLLTQDVSVDVKEKKVLLVDDIADTGRSLQRAMEHLQHQGAAEVQVATVYRKPLSMVPPNFCEKETELWVVFPWDVKETIRRILGTYRGIVSIDAAKLAKAGLPKQMVEEVLREIAEAKKC
jgi:hypoxanthine phosphoribosyltransferase